MKIVKCFATLFVQLILVLILLETVGRLFDPLGISYYPNIAAYLDTLIIEEPIGYRNQPNLKGNFFGAPVSINSIGLRDQEVSAKTDEEFRILVMGDSMPFGIGVPVDESYPVQLEKILQQQSSSPLRIRTLNMGVPSYNTEQELIQMQQIGLELQPDLVTFLFSANDLQSKMWVFDKRKSWFANWGQRSYAASLIYTLYKQFKLRRSSAQSSLAANTKFRSSQTAPKPNQIQSKIPTKWNATLHDLTEINRILKQRGIPFILFTYNEAEVNTLALSQIANLVGFPVFHLKPLTDPRWDHYKQQDLSNSVTDSHPNKLGNRIIATMIAEQLVNSSDILMQQ